MNDFFFNFAPVTLTRSALACFSAEMRVSAVTDICRSARSKTMCIVPCWGREGTPPSSHAYTQKEKGGGVNNACTPNGNMW